MMRRVLLVLLMLAVAATAFARVGGGESFSGGGSSGGGGDSDGSAELIFYLVRFLFWLTIEYPAIGIPVDIVVIIIVIKWLRRRNAAKVLTISTHGGATPSAPQRLDALRRFDPNFSEITFADFCYSLYARAHHARGEGDLERYAPYLSAGARNALRSRNRGELRAVKGIVVGAFRIAGVRGLDTPSVTVTVVYESNYTEVTAEETSWYVREQWMLERARDILSPPPEKAKADHCPHCGAALQTRTDGACQYCGVKVQSGAFNWFVRSITLLDRETRGPLLTSDVPEQGTNRPTVWQQHFADRRGEFGEAHPGFDWAEFQQRVVAVANELQAAWTSRDWERVRPLESESLFQMHRYWIDAYKKQRLRNVVDGFRVKRVEPVKIDRDAFYESVTVRLWAEGRDHTLDDQGQVVSGSKTRLREWSEYWTFIRTRTGVEGTQQRPCPNCGAAVRVGATGVCEFCGGKLSSGSFDWVLSRIEQDEVYSG